MIWFNTFLHIQKHLCCVCPCAVLRELCGFDTSYFVVLIPQRVLKLYPKCITLIFLYICCITLNPTRIVTYLLMRNRTTRFVLFNTSTPVDLFHHLHGTSGLILISLPFLLHLTTIGNNAQNICCKFRSSICTLNRHLSGTPCSCSRNT